jgi:Protein of unknown function (DUF2795)
MNVDLPNLGSLGIGRLQQYLQGVNLPAQKEELASSAESNGAPQNVVNGIRNAAQNQFNSQDGGRGHGRDRGRATVFGARGRRARRWVDGSAGKAQRAPQMGDPSLAPGGLGGHP